MEHTNDFVVMLCIMIVSGLLTTMNVWSDKISDIRLSLNDVYMSLLMTGWMFFLMGLFYNKIYMVAFGFILVVFNIWCIRTQFMITQKQYIQSMIPHHSMAVHMSKKLLEKENNIENFLKGIITNQNAEIEFMKNKL